MAAKNIDPLNNGSDPQSLESGAQDWAMTCGVCHAGGGQLEYDRNMSPYSATSPGGDRYMWKRATLSSAGAIVAGPMSATNKAEVDCLLCHLNGSKNGQAWLQTMGCGASNPIGPSNDPTCSGTSAFPGVPPAGPYPAGTAYDSFNRNLGIKTGNFNLAASLGIGAIGTLNAQGIPTGVTGVPTTIAKDYISYTPSSQNCSVCHARDDSQTGLPGMMAMKYGYGNYNVISPPGTALDTDTGAANAKLWFELGCKTGMGKRAHRIGAGPNDKWGMSMFVPSTFNGTCNHADKPCMGDPIPNKMPDADVHDINPDTKQPTGMSCGSCHYALGSTSLQGGSVTIPAGTHHGISYPEETVLGGDHQFAQSDSSPDTKSKNNLDGTVSCESCHITHTHPRLELVGGKYFIKNSVPAGTTENPASDPGLLVKTPTHSGFMALHIEKIACSTCHIPEVYAAPGRLKYRDWTVGEYKGGFRNMLDWNFDLVTGSHKTVPMLHAWITKEGEKKIYPFLPSVMPIWVKPSTNSLLDTGTEIPGGTYPTATPVVAPVKHRDTTAAALIVKAAHPEFDIRLNGGNTIPLFDGFSLSDSWEIDTKAEIDAFTSSTLTVNGTQFATKLKLFNTMFDITHGVAPSEWALGGTMMGGCVSCHSSADPKSPVYSSKSIAFFESYQQPLNNAGMGIGKYDMVKNWFAMFADYDCTAMVNGLCSSPATCEAMCTMQMGYTAAQCSATTGFCAQAATACVGFPFNDDALFNPMTGAPANNAFLGACTQQMAGGFDAMMGFPTGTAMQMGMFDGIAGLQGFAIRETVDGTTKGCNPFAGPVSFSPMPGQSVNNCMPDAGHDPYGGMLQGVCSGAVPPIPGACNGGFRNGGPCMVNADCQGALADGMPLLYSRGEARSHFKIAFQQSGTGASSKVTWPIAVEQNPSNPAHAASWDQALKCVDQMGFPTACTDGGYIQTTVNGNDFLGYTPAYLTYLKSLVVNPVPCPGAIAYMSKSYDPLDPTNRTVIFDGSASLLATSYTWDFGDGTTGSGVTATHAYTAEGTYDVKLTVTGDCGGPSTVISQVTIQSVPVAAYTTSILPVPPLTVKFDGTASLNAASYAWNFGDGNSSTLATVDHTYTVAGTYNVSLTVTSAGGSTSKKIGQVTVGKLVPVCLFNVSYDPADPAKRTIIYDATASTNASTYEWTFGDAATGTGVIVTHLYGAAGTYYPTLKVTSPTGHTCTKNSRIILK